YSVVGHARASEILRDTVARLSASNVLLTLSPIDTPLFDTLNKRAIALADELGLPLLASYPTLYAAGGADVQEIHQAVLRNTPATEIWHWSNWVRDFHALEPSELAKKCVAAGRRQRHLRGGTFSGLWMHALQNTERLVDMVSYQWAKAPVSL